MVRVALQVAELLFQVVVLVALVELHAVHDW